MDLKEIKVVIDMMTKNGISEFELEQQDFKIRLKKGQNPEFQGNFGHQMPVFAQNPMGQPVQQMAVPTAPASGGSARQ